MRVGVDTFTLRDLNLNPYQQLDLVARLGLEGALFGSIRVLSPGTGMEDLKAIKSHADKLGLYSNVSLSATCNPHQSDLSIGDMEQQITLDIERAAGCGWLEIHASLGGGNERYHDVVQWPQQLADSASFIRRLGPTLREHGARINIENHGDATTFELIRLIEQTGPDITGICLDTANVLCQCEDPVEAARRAAPYTHMTHVKDAAIAFHATGYRRQTLPAGRGMLDWRKILSILAAEAPNLPLSIEDHKWLFDFHIFDSQWIRLHTDLTLEEYAKVVKFGVECEQASRDGRIPEMAIYENIPHIEEMEPRLAAARDFLRSMVETLGLNDRPDHKKVSRKIDMMVA